MNCVSCFLLSIHFVVLIFIECHVNLPFQGPFHRPGCHSIYDRALSPTNPDRCATIMRNQLWGE